MGRLLEAEAVLAQNGGLAHNPDELDLLARMAARQARFDEARQHWNAAMQLKPGNEIYRECLEGLTPARRIVRLIANSQDTILGLLAVAMVALAIGALIFVSQL